MNVVEWLMNALVRHLLTIARVAVIEPLEHPATFLMTQVAVWLTLTVPLLQFQQFSEDGRLARDSGLATLFLFGFFLATGFAVRLGREVRDGVAAVALVKAVSRGAWLWGKFLGHSAALLLFACSQGLAILLAERLSPHYRTLGTYADLAVFVVSISCTFLALIGAAVCQGIFRRRFVLSANLLLPIALVGALCWSEPLSQVTVHWGVLGGVALLWMALLVVAAGAICFATFVTGGRIIVLSMLLVVCGFVVPGGWMHPDFRLFWMCDALTGRGALPASYLVSTLGYGCVCCAFFMWAAAFCFRRRDIL